MTSTARTQHRYDHRLRELVQMTGDITLATQHGVPASTARGWLTQSKTDVVSLDVIDLDTIRLRSLFGRNRPTRKKRPRRLKGMLSRVRRADDSASVARQTELATDHVFTKLPRLVSYLRVQVKTCTIQPASATIARCKRSPTATKFNARSMRVLPKPA